MIQPGSIASADDEATPAAGRLPVNTYDVFDTLIARRCIEPGGIFDQIAQRSGIPDFEVRRRAAEAAVAHGPYTLTDIYQRLAVDAGLPDPIRDHLMSLEIELELDAVIPIAENIAQVTDGDILISDMYLGQATIRRLLDQAGLARKVGLVVTSAGKSSGQIWPVVLQDFDIQRHMGDNLHSDVRMAQLHGVPAAHTSLFEPTHVENWLIGLGLRDLGELIREARLRTWHADPVTRRLQLIQTQINFPLLLLSSLRLMQFAREREASHLLFSSRDCHLWHAVYQVLAQQIGPDAAPGSYFYTSRLARTQGSDHYLEYARDMLGERGVVVDTCGSGWSTSLMMQRLGLADRDLFFLHHMPMPPVYGQKAAPDLARTTALAGPAHEGVNNMFLEMSNSADHGSVRDVRLISGAPVPMFDNDPRPDAIRELVRQQERCFRSMLPLLQKHPLQRTLSLLPQDLDGLVGSLYQYMCQDPTLLQVFASSHLQEDQVAMQRLGLT